MFPVLRWTHKGMIVNDTVSHVYLEENGTHVIITAERLVSTDLTVTIHASVQGGSGIYSMPQFHI